jgi:hypothetical protein
MPKRTKRDLENAWEESVKSDLARLSSDIILARLKEGSGSEWRRAAEAVLRERGDLKDA